MGKTSATLAILKVLLKEHQVKRMLVVAPLRVCYLVWPAERSKWTDFNHLKLEILHGSKKEAALQRPADVYAINPDGLPWLLQDRQRLKQLGVDMLVIDESSKFKHTNTKRFKLLKPYLPMFKRRLILTGSPNPNGYLDLFGQIYILDLGKTLGQYITHYRMKYFYPTGFGGYTWKLKPEGDKEIQRAIKPLVLRLDAADYIKLPEVTPNVIRVDLPDKARKVYDELEEEMFTELDNGEVVTAVSSGGALNKCSQVANGALYHMFDVEKPVVTSREFTEVHTAKVDALVDLVEELQGQPLLVGYEFKHDLVRIRAALGKDTPYIGSGISMKETAEIERRWNAGDISVLLGHPASMGHGLNLQGSSCKQVCWFGITWDYELYDQFIRRARREGNKSSNVIVHHIVARETVDEAKMRALRYKGKTQQGLLDALRTYRKGRTL